MFLQRAVMHLVTVLYLVMSIKLVKSVINFVQLPPTMG